MGIFWCSQRIDVKVQVHPGLMIRDELCHNLAAPWTTLEIRDEAC